MKIATRDAYGNFLKTFAKDHKDVVVLDADLSKSTKTAEFAKVCPERFFNVGIAEQNLMGVAAGMAAMGKIPFASTFAMFATGRAYEIVRNSICYNKLNVKICATHAGLTVGEDGASHQALEDISLMRSLPNMVVVNPADATSAKALLEEATRHEGPVYVRLGRAPVKVIYDESETFEIGKAKVLSKGSDVTLIATGIMVEVALEVAAELEKEGINAGVIDIHTIKPIDEDALVSAANETKCIYTLEEHSVIGGLYSAVSEVLSKVKPTCIKPIGVKDVFGESGKPMQLLEKHGMTKEVICQEIAMDFAEM